MSSFLKAGRSFYAYFTPVILLIGFVGNSLSLNVFISKNMRSLSASTYLAALSTSDLLTLVFYVTIEWLRKGLVYLKPEIRMHFIDINGELMISEGLFCYKNYDEIQNVLQPIYMCQCIFRDSNNSNIGSKKTHLILLHVY